MKSKLTESVEKSVIEFFKKESKIKAMLKEKLVEAKLGGTVTDDSGDSTGQLGEVYNQITMGMESYHPLDFARVYRTTKPILKIPIGTYGSASALSSGAFTDSPKSAASITVTLDEEYGVTVTWTRSAMQDSPWDLLAEQLQGAGWAIQDYICNLLVTALESIDPATIAGGEEVDLTAPMTFAEFTHILSHIDIEGYGAPDYLLCSPAIFWELLGLEQLTSALYNGGEEVMRTGVLKTTFGVTIIRCSKCDPDECIAVNSKKAIALVYRDDVTVEEFEHPEDNEYGFVIHVRAKVGVMNKLAVARGETTVVSP